MAAAASSSLSISDVDEMFRRFVFRGNVNIDSATLRSSAKFVCPENDSDFVRDDVTIRISSWLRLLSEAAAAVAPSDPFEPDSLFRCGGGGENLH